MASSTTKSILIERQVSLKPYTTLKTGGEAEFFATVRTVDEYSRLAISAQKEGLHVTILGMGSNILPSDQGVPGLVIHNVARLIQVNHKTGEILADTGCSFQDLFLKSAQAGLKGFEFAVGIPGTLGGALVSNAGAYRSNVSEFLTELEVVNNQERTWVKPHLMEFSYRDSILRRVNPPPIAVLRVKFKLEKGDSKTIYDEARDYQRQRISKQPPQASAGSFFKNVYHDELAQGLKALPKGLKDAGVVPAGFLIMEAGLAGYRHGGAMFSLRHANFIVNVGNATATEIWQLAELAKKQVFERFGVHLEEEVLYLGNWGHMKSSQYSN